METLTTPIRIAHEVRKNNVGYALFELQVKNDKVVAEKKVHEWDFLPITLATLSAILQGTCPDYKLFKSSTGVADEAVSGQPGSEVKKQK